MKKQVVLLSSLLLVGMLTRIIPHWPNFTAVGAVALAGGALFRLRWIAYLVPVALLFLSDLFINNVLYASFHPGFQWFTSGFGFIYGGFLLMVLIGRFGIGSSRKGSSVLAAGIGGSLLFYLISNFGVWLGSPMYPQTLGGLVSSYVAGLPFLVNQAAGTLVYSAVIFGVAWYGIPKITNNYQESY